MTHIPHHGALDTEAPQRYQASRRVTIVSVVLNTLLALSQIIIGVIGRSQALVADGIHTLSDLITDAMVLFALKHSAKGADEEHPYGHGRIETAVTLLLGALLFAVGTGIAVRAALQLLNPEPLEAPALIALWVAIATLLTKEGLYHYTMYTARRFGSEMLRANAWHHRSDAVSSLIVVVGITGSQFGLGYLDGIAAIIVALMIIKIGLELAWNALRELIDTGLSSVELSTIRHTIAQVSGVRGSHFLRTRRIGGQTLADVHVVVDSWLSVSEGQQISETVRSRLIKEIDSISDVSIHIDAEDDVHESKSSELPLRQEVLQRLQNHFHDIPEARMIERVTLHYLKGRIDVELLLPFTLTDDLAATQELKQRFAQAARQDHLIGSIEIHFH